MRKIEQEMKAAIQRGINWQSDNTMVAIVDNVAKVYLHQNHIADVNLDTLKPVVNLETLRNWPTNTTKSRLRALNIDLVTKRGVMFINGEKV